MTHPIFDKYPLDNSNKDEWIRRTGNSSEAYYKFIEQIPDGWPDPIAEPLTDDVRNLAYALTFTPNSVWENPRARSWFVQVISYWARSIGWSQLLVTDESWPDSGIRAGLLDCARLVEEMMLGGLGPIIGVNAEEVKSLLETMDAAALPSHHADVLGTYWDWGKEGRKPPPPAPTLEEGVAAMEEVLKLFLSHTDPASRNRFLRWTPRSQALSQLHQVLQLFGELLEAAKRGDRKEWESAWQRLDEIASE